MAEIIDFRRAWKLLKPTGPNWPAPDADEVEVMGPSLGLQRWRWSETVVRPDGATHWRHAAP